MWPFPQDFFSAALDHTGLHAVILDSVGTGLLLLEIVGYITLAYLLVNTMAAALAHVGDDPDDFVSKRVMQETRSGYRLSALALAMITVLVASTIVLHVTNDRWSICDAVNSALANWIPEVEISPKYVCGIGFNLVRLGASFLILPFVLFSFERHGPGSTVVVLFAMLGAMYRAMLILSHAHVPSSSRPASTDL